MKLLQQLMAMKNENNSVLVRELMLERVEMLANQDDERLNRRLLHQVIEMNVSTTRALKNQMRMIELLSVTDSLTQIYNRHKFNDEISEKLELYKRYKQKASLIMFDIDHFKRVNDTYGHNVGDDVLKQLASMCHAHLRKTDILARWGGEEFVIMLPNTGLQEALLLAEKTRAMIDTEVFPEVGHVTCSFGVSEVSEEDTPESWVGKSDAGLYEAKQNGRNRVCSR